MPYTPIPTGAATSDIPVLTTTAVSGLSAESDLGALTTGLLKISVAGGVATPSTAVAGTDYLAPDHDVISRQTLGADAQDITFTVDGDVDERVVIDGYGEGGTSVGCDVKYNATVCTVTKVISANGAAPTGTGTLPGATVANEVMGFTMVLDLRRQGNCDRGGTVAWWISYGATNREYYLSAVTFRDSATAVTGITLAGASAGYFKAGFKVICRRRKMSA